MCDLCNIERDTIRHRLYECETVVHKVESVFKFLKSNCRVSSQITVIEYLFGKIGPEHIGLNHILLELKKCIFYSKAEFISSPLFLNIFLFKVQNLIIKEKLVSLRNSKYDVFCNKWQNFTKIYDFRGPDPFIVYTQKAVADGGSETSPDKTSCPDGPHI